MTGIPVHCRAALRAGAVLAAPRGGAVLAALRGGAALAALACCLTAPSIAVTAPAAAATPGNAATTPGPATVPGPTTAFGEAVTASGKVATARSVGQPRRAVTARPGSNLLLNPGGRAGDVSAKGWDAVTVPGWQVTSGLPTVVRYGTPKFPRATGGWPAVRHGRLFAGGAGRTARLTQAVSLRRAATAHPVRYRLSAWLGGATHSRASLRVAFISAGGRVLARRAVSRPGHGAGAGRLAKRAASGKVPAGAVSARITLMLASSLKNVDGPWAPFKGYDRAVAAGLRFSVSAPVQRPPPLRPPAPHVPSYQHVFLFYFENEDFHAVIGNTRQAPYLNSLLPRASLLARFFAEEHPSDGNYLALAGGSTFGIPLNDPLEENPRYTIHARNIGVTIDAAHETWKEYRQSATGPCDDTVHKYYWDDDLPMTYFADVRDRPAYCSAHLVPLEALRADLASARRTPSFAWLGANDCTDMEGCGIKAGDEFLARELGAIMRSPAWRAQRSLAIITFDEDGFDRERPAQRVPTVILGSSGVRAGFVSHVRYTHYSLLATIEAALGLPTLTRNDRYARPVNDVFGPGAAPRVPSPAADSPAARLDPAADQPGAATGAADAPAGGTRAPARAAGRPASTPGPPAGSAGPAAARHRTAFVVNSGSNTVTPVDLVTRRKGAPIRVGRDPEAIAVTPDGGTAYVANAGSGTVTPIDTATRRAGAPIPVGKNPKAIAITPDGRTAYVANDGAGSVTPVDTGTGRAGTPIRVGRNPRAIAVAPGGRTAYVLDWGSAAVTPISTVTNRAGAPIPVGSYPVAIAFAPGGKTAYVAGYGSNTVTPVTVATGRPGRAIRVSQAPAALAVTPDGTTVYSVGADAGSVSVISTAAGRVRGRIRAGYTPAAIALSGGTAYVVNTISGTLTPISTRTAHPRQPIGVGVYTYPTAIALSGGTAVVIGTYAGRVTLVDTRTRHVTARLAVGNYPVAVAIAR
ncbi:MAG TPA: alkaline phosphatase family protein [Streptosporangiaceae bacterium]|jgi:YVTN family beta-propeller protein